MRGQTQLAQNTHTLSTACCGLTNVANIKLNHTATKMKTYSPEFCIQGAEATHASSQHMSNLSPAG